MPARPATARPLPKRPEQQLDFGSSSLELELVAFLRSCQLQSAGWQLQHRMGPQTQGDPSLAHILSDLQYQLLLIQEDNVDGELHPPCVHAFAGSDPQAFARGQAGVLQQPCPSLCAGIRHPDSVAEQNFPGNVSNAQRDPPASCGQTSRVAQQFISR